MSKAFFVDTTLCTACRGCQVACKQWHDLPAEKTQNLGSFQNPPDLSFQTYKLVRMNEVVADKKFYWLFFPDQCRHCVDAPCQATAYDESAIYKDEATGAIIYTANTKNLDTDAVIESCPYNIPRKGPDNTLYKCDFCNDRIHNGLKPACVTTCPTGTMNFGDREEMLALAQERLAKVQKRFPKAQLLNPDDVNVIYLVTQEPSLYAEYAVADNSRGGISRSVAIRKMMGPFARLMKV